MIQPRVVWKDAGLTQESDLSVALDDWRNGIVETTLGDIRSAIHKCAFTYLFDR